MLCGEVVLWRLLLLLLLSSSSWWGVVVVVVVVVIGVVIGDGLQGTKLGDGTQTQSFKFNKHMHILTCACACWTWFKFRIPKFSSPSDLGPSTPSTSHNPQHNARGEQRNETRVGVGRRADPPKRFVGFLSIYVHSDTYLFQQRKTGRRNEEISPPLWARVCVGFLMQEKGKPFSIVSVGSFPTQRGEEILPVIFMWALTWWGGKPLRSSVRVFDAMEFPSPLCLWATRQGGEILAVVFVWALMRPEGNLSIVSVGFWYNGGGNPFLRCVCGLFILTWRRGAILSVMFVYFFVTTGEETCLKASPFAAKDQYALYYHTFLKPLTLLCACTT